MDGHIAGMLTGPLAVGLASIGPSIGIGMLTSSYFQAVARQPEVQGNLTTYFFIPLAMVELLGLFGFVTYAVNAFVLKG